MDKTINTSKEKIEYYKGANLNEGYNQRVAPMPKRKAVKKHMKHYSEAL